MQQAWYPVALSEMIPAGTSAGVVIDGAEIVVWRDTSGAAHTWEDRCPHRGMKLSFGFVRGDHIACLYHGWEYDTGGTCRYIPAHPQLEVPKTICVKTYGVAEAGGTSTNKFGQTLAEIQTTLGDAITSYDALNLTQWKFAPITPLVRCP